MQNTKIFQMPFANIYPMYVQKAQRKGRTQQEVDAAIAWLTGYDADGLARQLAARADVATFFAQAPRLNPNADRIRGTICGYRVEEIADPLMRQIRCLDKLIDDIAKGKKPINW